MEDDGQGAPLGAGNPTGLEAAARAVDAMSEDGDDEEHLAMQELHAMEQRWSCVWAGGAPGGGVDPELAALYGWNTPAFNSDEALRTFEEGAQAAVQLLAWAEDHGDPDARIRAEKVMRCVHESYTMLVAGLSWQGDDAAPLQSPEDIIMRFASPPQGKLMPIQQLFKFALVWCRRLKLRHRGDIVYREIVARGKRTKAWVPATDVNRLDISTLERLVTHIFTQRHSRAMHSLWLRVGTQAFTDKLRICVEADFPDVQTSREWLAFSDGLYSVYTDTFISYDDDRFSLPSDLAACAYHPMPFAPSYFAEPRQPGGELPRGLPLHPLSQVPTPLMDTIFDTQKFDGHTRFWLMAMMGRLLYWSGTLDNWQVCPYLKGAAGTGKSTLINFMTAVYTPADICIIGNDVQETFGLEGLDDSKLIWVAPEVRSTFSLDQGQFQSLVSNEPMMMAVKHKAARMGAPKSHGMMAGNMLPAKYSDDSGSVQRRLAIFAFLHSVAQGETRADLLVKMKTQELASIVRKINWCYQQAVVMVGTRDLWSSGLLSPQVVEANNRLSYDMNPLRSFLNNNSDLAHKVGERRWCPETLFLKAFKEHTNQIGKRDFQWNSDFYDSPFKKEGLAVRRATYRWTDSDVFIDGNIVWGACPSSEWPADIEALAGEGQENPQLHPLLQVEHDMFAVSADELWG
ncbi:hypothetical protein JKP88DRAFT_241306 [Tribonema minus]|uniref:NrS-1 polymerase-like helicase domain-containing protein n=1 Tax=Tribonema minus TaxID=303371 RepID=A0A835YYH5_9STRA|nr:hypothetical protein JKP88DRAFT_241306 [Tribonema minus]